LAEAEVDVADGRGVARRERAAVQRSEAIAAINEAARVVLREHTVFDLSAAVLAKVAGRTRQVVHHYYPSMRHVVFALADELTVAFQEAGLGLDPAAPDWPHLFADQVADIALADPGPNRQVLLVSASQGRGLAAATAGTSREIIPALERRNPAGADRATWLTVTLFRGVLFTWAAEGLSDDEFRRALHDVADVVPTQRRIWAEGPGRGVA
tara:strand:- start:2876 stop:3508 length:633 start_codon:yes stop_codon:yes gene_type:complete